ncbi:MAG TPA: amidase [Kofleriaceae bacterium]
MDLVFESAWRIAERIRRKQVSAVEVLDAVLAQCARYPSINAVVTFDDRAREAAIKADEWIARGEVIGDLHGVPITIKDTIETAGLRTTAGAPMLAQYVPATDAPAVTRLRRAGAIVLGKTNTPMFGMHPQTFNDVFGRTNNPWDESRTPGGSSGGPAAAVCSGMSFLDLCSDMSGSIRIPAHFCGVYAMRPTVHRVPSVGHIPDFPGGPRTDRLLATLGPIARSLRDVGLAMRVLTDDDDNPRDTETAPVPWRDQQPPPASALRIAWAETLPGVPVAAALRETVARVASTLASAGVRVEQRLPDGLEAHRAPWLELFKGFMHMVRTLYPGSVPPTDEEPPSLPDYARALHARDGVIREWDQFLTDYDALLLPVSLDVAFPHAPPKTPLVVDGASVESWRIDHLLYPFSFTGQPTVVIPAGVHDGLPIGVQLIGRRWQDERLLATAATVDALVAGYRVPPRLIG